MEQYEMRDFASAAAYLDASNPIAKQVADHGTKSDKESGSLPRLEFWWDKIVIILMTMAGAVAAVDNIERLVISSEVECYVLNNTNRDQAAYVNGFCYAFLPKKAYIPFYLPYFVIIGDSLVVAVHYLWVLMCQGQFRSFFSSVTKLELHRNPKTGMYDHKTMQTFRAMEKTAHSHWMLVLYVLKLCLQLLLLLAGCGGYLFAHLIVYEQQDFLHPKAHVFMCPDDSYDNSDGHWVPDTQVHCVHTSREILTTAVSVAINIAIYGIGAITTLMGLVILMCVPHRNNLMAENVAKYVFESPFLPEDYKANSSWISACSQGCCRCRNDFEFLVVVLFRSNVGKGRLLRDIQIQCELDSRIEEHSVQLHHHTIGGNECDLQTKLHEKLTDQRAIIPNKVLMVTIGFGSTRCAYMLYSKFRAERVNMDGIDMDVVAINFDPYLHSKALQYSVGRTGITVIQVPEHIYSKGSDDIQTFEDMVLNAVDSKIVQDCTEQAHAQAQLPVIRRIYLVCLQCGEDETDNKFKRIFTLIDSQKPEIRPGTISWFLSLSLKRDRMLTPQMCYGRGPAVGVDIDLTVISDILCGDVQHTLYLKWTRWNGSYPQIHY